MEAFMVSGPPDCEGDVVTEGMQVEARTEFEIEWFGPEVAEDGRLQMRASGIAKACADEEPCAHCGQKRDSPVHAAVDMVLAMCRPPRGYCCQTIDFRVHLIGPLAGAVTFDAVFVELFGTKRS